MQQLQELALDVCQALGTPRALAIAILAKNEEWSQIVNLTIDPTSYTDPDAYLRDAQATAFLKKVEGLPTGIDTAKAAIEKWVEAELRCSRFNDRIDLAGGGNPSTPLGALLLGVQHELLGLIGRKPPQELNCSFGNGSTFEMSGILKLLPNKLTPTPSMTENAWSFLTTWNTLPQCRGAFRCIDASLPWVGQLFPFIDQAPSLLQPAIVKGNRFDLVPKNGKTDRAIAIEPTLNVYYQLGLGKALRTKLRRRGLLEKDSQEVHRKMAREGSLYGNLATLDLSSASDTIGCSLVRETFPWSWFEELNAARSPYTAFDRANGEDPMWVPLSKFSSMGNGYTFELETALFAATCLHIARREGVTLIARHNFSVYGDDIIVPTEIAGQVADALKLLGFILNMEKSFVGGPFRESCGGDYFKGVDVRPVYQDCVPDDPSTLFSLHNRLARLPHKGIQGLEATLAKVRSFIPFPFNRLGGPERYGDTVLHGVEPRLRVRNSIPQLQTLASPRLVFPLRRWSWDQAVATMLYTVDRSTYSEPSSISTEQVGAKPEIVRSSMRGDDDKDVVPCTTWVAYRP